ncbi:SRPBCC family protein [Nocardioides cheoyonin]|uniref:SRPBCC family protein n=1 Tax=Nocardioides cheoyonin TaxID=3156615 RepID=UPI0032B3814E
MTARYAFVDSWVVAAPPERVRDVVVDLEHYPEWWPQVVAVVKLGPDDSRVLCRSALPYTLDLLLHAVTRDLPVVEVRIGGDLVGSARWTLTPAGGGTRMDYEQAVEVRGALAVASYLARPMLRWNHARMMAGGRYGLVRRLEAQAESSADGARRSS